MVLDDATIITTQASTESDLNSDDTATPSLIGNGIGCNDDHEGMNYQVIMDQEIKDEKLEKYHYSDEPQFQEGKL